MKRFILFGAVTIGLATCVSAQQPVILSFEHDGSLTWSNAYSNAIASIERLTDVVTTGSTVTVTETLAVSDGSTDEYDYTVDHPPIINPSVTISDGTYSWNDETGYSTNPPGFIAWAEYSAGTVHADYPLLVPTTGTSIQVEYSYLPVGPTQEWVGVYSEHATGDVSQAAVEISEETGIYRVVNYEAVAYWPMDGDGTDATGNGYDGTVHGATPAADRNGQANAALRFDGVDDYLQLSQYLPICSTDYTFAGWVNIPMVGQDGLQAGERVGILVGNWPEPIQSSWEIHAAGQMRLYWNEGEISHYGTTDLRDGAWHHLAFVADRSLNTVVFYLDGAVETTAPTAGATGTFSTYHRIGGDYRARLGLTTQNLNGTLDDWRLYDRALDFVEVQALANP